MRNALKIFIIALSLFMFSMIASAQTTVQGQISSEQQLSRVTAIGTKLLDSNGLPTKVKFVVSEEEEVNAYANIDNEVHVFKGLLKMVENDEELASVIAHEIGHIANSHIQKQNIIAIAMQAVISTIKKPFVSKTASSVSTLSLLKASRSAEYEADLTGVDLMIGAGYNPQAMISFLSKIAQNYIDVIQTHPSGNKRLMNVYDYTSYNFPDKLQNDYNTESYRKFKTYADEVVRERQANPKKMLEYTKKQEKLKLEKLKRAESIRKDSNPWAAAFNVLRATSQFSR